MTTFEALKVLFRLAVREGRAGLLPKDSDLELTKEPFLYRDEWWWLEGEWVISYNDMTCQWVTWPHYAVKLLKPDLAKEFGL